MNTASSRKTPQRSPASITPRHPKSASVPAGNQPAKRDHARAADSPHDHPNALTSGTKQENVPQNVPHQRERPLSLTGKRKSDLRSPVTESNRRPSPYHAGRSRPAASSRVVLQQVTDDLPSAAVAFASWWLRSLSLG